MRSGIEVLAVNGHYHHVRRLRRVVHWKMDPIINPSTATSSNPADADQFNGAGKYGNGARLADGSGKAIQGRCGYGPRLPFLVVSPWAKERISSTTP